MEMAKKLVKEGHTFLRVVKVGIDLGTIGLHEFHEKAAPVRENFADILRLLKQAGITVWFGVSLCRARGS